MADVVAALPIAIESLTPNGEANRPGFPSLLFQPVADEKAVKNRLHLDIAPSSRTQDGEVQRLLALGARLRSDDPRVPWVVLTDPEGNEFCVLPPRPEVADAGG
ncbi:VOC family protein [Rhodococcus tibetensis]|uniref:Glyoxalase-like domain-containing protein n=1 Tax=Rhodococcus tibetensis TaxID=2965064 RepID=A0ABT1QEC8_9NOCA|nr:VOC family protein [Rhodococcus sp. FXJ9.536]MCQ4119455.1 hypothetical protein [Rhodococcus sp. FXJ9.536]